LTTCNIRYIVHSDDKRRQINFTPLVRFTFQSKKDQMTAMTSSIKLNELKTSRTYAGISLELRKKQRKKQFLQAGLNAFGSTGFRTATVRSLCKEAQLTDRYFYQSYGSLEGLLVAVYERCMTELSKKILQSISSEFAKSDAKSAISAGLDAYFKELEDPRVARICMIELEGISPEVNRLYYKYIDSFAALLVELTRRAYPDWRTNQQEQGIIALSFVGAMRQAATNWLITDYATERKVMVSATSKLFFGIMMLIEEES